MSDKPPQVPGPPKGFAAQWVRSLLGFSVGTAIGLAPLLGNANVPGFKSLLSLFPIDMQSWLIPFSSFLMGGAAVVLTFLSSTASTPKGLRRYFGAATIWTVVAFVALFLSYMNSTARVFVVPEDRFVTFVVSATKCQECASLSNARCIEQLSLDTARIAGCYGDQNIRSGQSTLGLAYMALVVGLGAMVGLLNAHQMILKKQRS